MSAAVADRTRTGRSPKHHMARQATWAGLLLGFALGGFFDGILLHQILQWHHLLSAVEGAAFRDLRVQILADGLFHALMYVLAVVGLWLLWRARRELARPHADRRLVADALLGFGAWHVVDAVLFHWLLGIHRIRMDTDVPLLWDLGWLFVFGFGALGLGLALRRGADRGEPPRPGGVRVAVPKLVVALVTATGAIAALPPPGTDTIVVLFKPGTGAERAVAALAQVEARIVWNDASGDVWAIVMEEPADAARRARGLYRHGALVVSTTMLPIGCLAWSRV